MASLMLITLKTVAPLQEPGCLSMRDLVCFAREMLEGLADQNAIQGRGTHTSGITVDDISLSSSGSVPL